MCGAASGCPANERVPADCNVLVKDELVDACEVADKTIIRIELTKSALACQVKKRHAWRKNRRRRGGAGG